MNVLSNLTASGWVLFALMLASWLGLIVGLIRRRVESSQPIGVAILTVWFIWLVTP